MDRVAGEAEERAKEELAWSLWRMPELQRDVEMESLPRGQQIEMQVLLRDRAAVRWLRARYGLDRSQGEMEYELLGLLLERCGNEPSRQARSLSLLRGGFEMRASAGLAGWGWVVLAPACAALGMLTPVGWWAAAVLAGGCGWLHAIRAHLEGTAQAMMLEAYEVADGVDTAGAGREALRTHGWGQQG